MSEKNRDETALAADTSTNDEPLAQPSKEPEPEAPGVPPSANEKSGKRSAAGIAWLALVASAIALGAAVYTVVNDWRSERLESTRPDPLADIRSRFAASDAALEEVEATLAELETTDATAANQLVLLRGDIDNRLQLLDALQARLANLEASMSALQGISTGARNTWLIAEAEYYLQIANAQLQLAGNPNLAALALGMADERIVQLADPALTEVRSAIADERAAIEAMGDPDIEGVTLTLASLARVVDTLPLKDIESENDNTGIEVDAEASGMGRAWASVKSAVSGLVRVSSPDENELPLLTPEAEYFLRTNLALQLQTARLAVLRGEQAAFEQSLDDARAWLVQYFNANSTQVESARITIDEIRNETVSAAKPDISGSLRLLRQYKTISEPAQ